MIKYMRIMGFKHIPAKNVYLVDGVLYQNTDRNYQGAMVTKFWLTDKLNCVPVSGKDLYVTFGPNNYVMAAEVK